MGKVTAVLALLFSLFFACPQATLAAEALDPSRVCSLTLVAHYNGSPLVGKRLRLYRVADGTTSTGFTLSGSFVSAGVGLNGLDREGWSSAAALLSGYATNNAIAAHQISDSDANGTVVFPSLTQGLYLVVGDALSIGTHTYYFSPFLVVLPTPTAQGGWTYDVTAYPKIVDPGIEIPQVFDLTVVLRWSDTGFTNIRPSTVGITLLRDGVVYSNYKLSARENWRHTWEDLSEEYHWSVVQKTSLDTYSVSYRSSGNVLMITDKIKSTTNNNGLEQIRDYSIPLTGILWWPVEVLAVAGIVLFAIGWRRRFRDGGETHAS